MYRKLCNLRELHLLFVFSSFFSLLMLRWRQRNIVNTAPQTRPRSRWRNKSETKLNIVLFFVFSSLSTVDQKLFHLFISSSEFLFYFIYKNFQLTRFAARDNNKLRLGIPNQERRISRLLWCCCCCCFLEVLKYGNGLLRGEREGEGWGHRSAGRGTHTFGHNLPNHLHNFPEKQPPATCLSLPSPPPLPSIMHWLWSSFCISLRKKWRKFDTKTNKNSEMGMGRLSVCVW